MQNHRYENNTSCPLWGRSSSFLKIRKGCKEHSLWRIINIIVFHFCRMNRNVPGRLTTDFVSMSQCLTITTFSRLSSPMSEGDVLEIKNSIFIQTNIIKWLDFYEIQSFFFPCLLKHFHFFIPRAKVERLFYKLLDLPFSIFVWTKLLVLHYLKLSYCWVLGQM